MMTTHTISIKNDLFPLIKLAMPFALTGIIQSGVFFFETLFLAHVGTSTLAAGALVSWLFGTIAVILFGILSSINVLVALKHGANDQDGISHIARDGLLLSVLLSIPAFFLFWNMSPIFLLFGQPQSVVVLAQSYLHALAWGLLPDFVMIAILEVIMGMGHARLILLVTIFSVSINILSSYILIFGKFGFPVLGIAGAGWGMTISCWITSIALIIYISSNKILKPYFSRLLHFHKPYFFLELLRVGVPMGVMYCFEVAFFFALTLAMGSLGSAVLAANQVVMQYLGLLMSTMFSIAQAVTVRMGHLLGAKENEAAKRASMMGMYIAIAFMIIVAMVYWFYPSILISVDFDTHNSANIEIVNYIKEFFILSAIFQIFEAVRISLFGVLRGLKDTNFTLMISIISFWCIAFPVGYFLAIYQHVGGKGFWMALVMGAVVSVFLLYWRVQLKMRHLIICK